MVRQTQLYQISYIYIKVFTQVPWTLLYSSFNERVDVNQDGPSLIIEA